MNPTRLHAIMSGDARDLRARLARIAMTCAEPFYRAAVGVRNAMFDYGIRKPKKLPRPVISIGNITTGGTGKTPMVIEIVRRLVKMGHTPAVLLRGYGNDESIELHKEINGPEPAHPLGFDQRVPIMVDPNRFRGGTRVLEDDHWMSDAVEVRRDVTVFVLDDGFQHRQLHRDVNLLLIDARTPFGFGRVVPRGLLREPGSRIRRADRILVTRCDRVDANELAALDELIRRITGKPPLAHLAHQWTGFEVFDSHLHPARLRDAASPSTAAPVDSLRSSRVVAACGIGDPDGFRRLLQHHVREIAAFCAFPDHHDFTQSDLLDVMTDAVRTNADAIVVTPKDFVKLERFLPESIDDPGSLATTAGGAVPVYRPRLTMHFLDGELEFGEFLQSRLAIGP